jgi:biotin/methionine sulfoxide reductase
MSASSRAAAAAKAAGREAVRLHPGDAAARGIADGEVVRIDNDRGTRPAGAVLTRDVRPHVVQLPTGAWFAPYNGQEEDGDRRARPALCVHGNPNVLTADVPSSRLSQGCTGQHALVEIERYQGGPPPVTVTAAPAPLRKEEL